MPDLDQLTRAVTACDDAKNWIDDAIREVARNDDAEECRVCMEGALDELRAAEVILCGELGLQQDDAEPQSVSQEEVGGLTDVFGAGSAEAADLKE